MRIIALKNGKWSEKPKLTLFPITIGYETSWLEFITVEQRYSEYFGTWENERFLETETLIGI